MEISTRLMRLIVDEGFDLIMETSLEGTLGSRRRGTGSPCVRCLQREKAMKSTNGLRRQTMAATAAAVVISFGLVAYSPGTALADPPGYTFTRLATGPGPGPGTDSFDLDFEPHSINAAGNVAFVADLKAGNEDIGEGVFASRSGQLLQIMGPGDPAPGGDTFGSGVLGMTPLNDTGDGAFVHTLSPDDPTLGLNAGLYRFSLNNPNPSAVVVPGVTPAPTGGIFAGVLFNTALNNIANLVFGGIAPFPQLTEPPGDNGLGVGLFMADSHNHIVKITAPGDPAPGSGVFDDAWNGWPNNRGTIGFEGHVSGEECIPIPGNLFACGSSVYTRSADGTIRSIAHQGDPAPGGGAYREAFGPVVNDFDDLVFTGDLTPAPGSLQSLGVFVNSAGQTSAVALPGDPMPGGGHFVTSSQFPYSNRINNSRTISFVARLDTDTDNDGVHDTGLYVRSNGTLRLVARSGSVIPGVGTIAHINNPLFASSDGPLFFDEPAINASGQVFFEATLTDGTYVLLVATPRPANSASR